MTIAQQLGVKEFPFIIKDNKGNKIYSEYSNRDWGKWEYDDNGNIIYYETSKGYWWKKEFDDKGNQIYYEDSNGYIDDKRPKPVPEYTMAELVNKLGHNFKIKK